MGHRRGGFGGYRSWKKNQAHLRKRRAEREDGGRYPSRGEQKGEYARTMEKRAARPVPSGAPVLILTRL